MSIYLVIAINRRCAGGVLEVEVHEVEKRLEVVGASVESYTKHRQQVYGHLLSS